MGAGREANASIRTSLGGNSITSLSTSVVLTSTGSFDEPGIGYMPGKVVK